MKAKNAYNLVPTVPISEAYAEVREVVSGDIKDNRKQESVRQRVIIACMLRDKGYMHKDIASLLNRKRCTVVYYCNKLRWIYNIQTKDLCNVSR